MSGHPFDFSPRDPGVWAEPYLMPDGSRPVTAIDEAGILRGVYFMRPGDDPDMVHAYLKGLLTSRGLRVIS